MMKDSKFCQVQLIILFRDWIPSEKSLLVVKQYLYDFIFYYIYRCNKTDVWKRLEEIPAPNTFKLAKENKQKNLIIILEAIVVRVRQQLPKDVLEKRPILVSKVDTFAQYTASSRD
jgi:hypothetical protein